MSDSKVFEDVFISYGRARRAETEIIAKLLNGAGFSTWWDSGLLPGDKYRGEIDEHLNGCKVAIIIWTPESIKSDWVLAEADHAWQLNKLINVHVPDVKPYQIPKPFNQGHSVDIANHLLIIEATRKRIGGSASVISIPAVTTVVSKPTLPNSGPGRDPATNLRLVFSRLSVGFLVAAMIGVISFGLLRHPGGPAIPIPHWDFKGNMFIGQPIPLSWNYEQNGSRSDTDWLGTPFLSEIDSAADQHFQTDSRIETYADGTHKFVGRINGTRYWRVRSVDAQTKAPHSDWSDAVQVTQYDSAYDRIKATHKIRVGVTTGEDQGFFKWMTAAGVQGFDINLVRLIAAAGAKQLGSKIDSVPVAVPWAELLDTIGQNSTDLLIASISKREERKQQFGIDFSDTYYCATQSLIFRTGTPTGSIHDMIAGKTVGVQNHTTVQKLAEDMAQGGSLFHVKPFETPESLVNDLITFKIDFGLIDTPFALVAQLEARADGRDRLSLKEFKSSDFPPAIPKEEQTEEYAIAVRQGETELLNLINNVIAGAKEDGSLALLLHQALQDYVSRSDSAPDSNNTAARSNPWDCSR